jgi:hypothetical protein
MQLVQGRVWRNVVVDGETVVRAGTPMVLRISDISKRRIAGRGGDVEIRAVSVTAVNERPIDAIPVRLGAAQEARDCRAATGRVDLKALSSHFTRGINRFTVDAAGDTVEVVLDVEM